MKIECDKCGAKYSIADEKVRGKTFKIRCKKCSNVIIVRDKGEAEAESDAGGDDEDAAAGWHLAVDGETVGPLSEQEVRDRFARGEIDRDTSVWQEGFDDWLLLGDVGAFSDLAAAAPAAAPSASADAPLGDLGGDEDDPFKGTGIGESDDYGGGEAAAGGAAASAAAASSFGDSDFGAGASSPGSQDAGSDPASPRVNQLSGARNENSVLFSLDSLSSVAMGGGGGSQPSVTANASTPLGGGLGLGDLGGGSGPSPAASSAPSPTGNSEGSGLIDIRAMGAMLGAQGAAADPGTDFDNDPAMGAPLPSFGGFTGLAEAKMEIGPSAEEQQERLVAEAAAAAAAAAASQPKGSNVPLYIIILLLAVGLGGIAYYVLNLETPEGKETIVYKPGESKTIIEYRDRPGAENEADDGSEEETEGDTEELVDDSAGGTIKRKRSGKKKKSTKSGDPDPLAKDDKAAETKAADDKKDSQTKKSQSVECLLDPNAPGCKTGGGGSKPKPKDKPPAGNLPASLGMADIKSGFASAKKSAASKCKSKAKPGDKVKVKVSIAGSTGKVTKADPQGSFAGTAVGSCVANELKKASFKKFQKTSMGAITSVKF